MADEPAARPKFEIVTPSADDEFDHNRQTGRI